ncbi:MAG: hypothetical protein ACK4MH_06730 [Brevundimonas sp.]|uniref:hypothetical protein n=1 Tax=Brevundimonas sp. TaxID=1871086 RepID=UPI00391C7AC8
MTSWHHAADLVDAARRQRGRDDPDGVGVDGASNVTFSKVPEGAVRDIQAMIEACSAEQAKPYVALLQIIQVQQTRAFGFLAELSNPRASGSVDYCRGQVVSSAEVYARASALFDHARDEGAESDTKVSRREVSRALFVSRIFEFQYPEIAQVADRYFGPREPGLE